MVKKYEKNRNFSEKLEIIGMLEALRLQAVLNWNPISQIIGAHKGN